MAVWRQSSWSVPKSVLEVEPIAPILGVASLTRGWEM
jgi:hypothetical protein